MIEVRVVNYTPNPELQIAIAARSCIEDKNYEFIKDELKQKDIERIIKTVILKNHLSVLEHANFTFSISGVTRILTHQLVRHRIASYSQLSQQRTDSSELKFSTPPDIKNREDLLIEYEELLNQCRELYKRLIERGISFGSARYVLPSSFETKIVATLNARSLFNVFAQRECQKEDWEFRLVARMMHVELMKISPFIFKYAGPLCQTKGVCPEGKRVFECGGYFGVSLVDSELAESIER